MQLGGKWSSKGLGFLNPKLLPFPCYTIEHLQYPVNTTYNIRIQKSQTLTTNEQRKKESVNKEKECSIVNLGAI